MTRIVIGLDLSLTATGLARIDTDPRCPLCGQGEITTSQGRHGPRCIRASCRYEGPGDTTPRVTTALRGSAAAGDTVTARADRLTNLAGKIVDWCNDADLVCIERPAYASNTGSVTDRAGLWWLVVARLIRGHRIPVVDVVNNHVKTYATGKGNAGKDAVLAETVRRYGHLVPTLADNNEADALQLAALGWHHLTGSPLVDLPQTHTRATSAVKWPTRA